MDFSITAETLIQIVLILLKIFKSIIPPKGHNPGWHSVHRMKLCGIKKTTLRQATFGNFISRE